MAKEPRFRRGIRFMESLDNAGVLEELPEGNISETMDWIDKQMRYEPRQIEGRTIAKIEQMSDEIASDLFAFADRALAKLYESVRVPVMEDTPAGPMPMMNGDGVMWAKDEHGNYIEEWDRLDGMDVEGAIMTLQRVITHASNEVAKVETRTLFAQYVKEDEYWASYRGQMGGTVDDRKAHANRESRDARFWFFLNYWIYKRLRDRLENLKTTKKDLEFARSRFLKDPDVIGRSEGERRPGRVAR